MPSPYTYFVLALTLVGCNQGKVILRGTVTEYPSDKAAPLRDGLIELLDQDGELYDSATTNNAGEFRVLAPMAETIYAVVSGEALHPAGFTGVSGTNPRLDVSRGTLFGVPDWQRVEWEEEFKGCPDLLGGGFVIGEVRNIDLCDPETLECELVSTTSVVLRSRDNEVYPACYLDEEGAAYDPEVERTGASGQFIIPVVPTGKHTLEVTCHLPQEHTTVFYSEVWMPADGVSPRLPAWVELPCVR